MKSAPTARAFDANDEGAGCDEVGEAHSDADEVGRGEGAGIAVKGSGVWMRLVSGLS